MVTLEVPSSYGLVILTSVMNWMILMWQALQLATARKKHGVKYPTMYENKHPSEFNCYQRAHQNSLEWNPGFLLFLYVSGLTTPLLSTAAGIVYNIGRIYYAKGYYKGSAHEGLWGLYGLFYLLGGTVYTAYTIFRS